MGEGEGDGGDGHTLKSKTQVWGQMWSSGLASRSVRCLWVSRPGGSEPWLRSWGTHQHLGRQTKAVEGIPCGDCRSLTAQQGFPWVRGGRKGEKDDEAVLASRRGEVMIGDTRTGEECGWCLRRGQGSPVVI